MRLRDLHAQALAKQQIGEAEPVSRPLEGEGVTFIKPVSVEISNLPLDTPDPVAEAVLWLAERLTVPCRIASLFSEWVPERDRDGGHWIADLNKARAEMGVLAFIGGDDKWWWKLPGTEEAAEAERMDRGERAAIREEDKSA